MPEESFDEFVHASLPMLSRYANALTGSAHAGEDLVQDTLVKVARAWRRIKIDGNPAAYARKVMLHTYLSAWRGLLRRPRTVPLSADWAGPDEYPLVDSRDLLRRALVGLPPAQRAVLVLSYLDDVADDDIAALIGRRPATVRSLRQRGLATLRRQFVREAQGSSDER
ncbi:sigma-70 family RNA polymerase sigma factor [Asanoa siamensis]|uniref:DNA-directed RNA polymerase sigma-70 factor n=1 Tax=Asanoa siamensis TaxID=926357 RepID=A0ABQ4CM75_9ACTN|nr:sigma-70 family RNA polymerase sigma factor [Asanoa siamensis]GIF72083.1 DNA-directed RNA polymerase sigma-70 factor [Asanoa siamensis]